MKPSRTRRAGRRNALTKLKYQLFVAAKDYCIRTETPPQISENICNSYKLKPITDLKVQLPNIGRIPPHDPRLKHYLNKLFQTIIA